MKNEEIDYSTFIIGSILFPICTYFMIYLPVSDLLDFFGAISSDQESLSLGGQNIQLFSSGFLFALLSYVSIYTVSTKRKPNKEKLKNLFKLCFVLLVSSFLFSYIFNEWLLSYAESHGYHYSEELSSRWFLSEYYVFVK
ncbi:hypothetical protein K6U55_00720 [Vibrio diabolicus]|uniref:hypothetical protein n=1 Tax=Vibrio diabolicus TaxID=50719 RepID=UPI00211B0872|nr:hypothetical protein [Vibrio diabolicus]MCG6240582.1 hypothetical protein [Vibrio diabolicus]